MIKKGLLFVFFLGMFTKLHAQKDRVEYLPNFDKRTWHFGFYLGLNQNDFVVKLQPSSITNPNIKIQPETGFNVGLIIDYRLHNNINLRLEPGLATNSKRIYFNYLATAQDSVRDVSSTFLHIPLVLKFSTNRLDNVRPFLLAGVSYDYNFSSNEKNQDDNSAGEFRTRTHNFMYEIGIGIDFYLYFFKFSPSIRGVFAINNELKKDNNPNSQWTSPISYLGTRGIFLTLAFE